MPDKRNRTLSYCLSLALAVIVMILMGPASYAQAPLSGSYKCDNVYYECRSSCPGSVAGVDCSATLYNVDHIVNPDGEHCQSWEADVGNEGKLPEEIRKGIPSWGVRCKLEVEYIDCNGVWHTVSKSDAEICE